MDTDSDAELDPPHELGIRWRRNGREVSGACLTVYRQHSAQRELKAATVAPGPDCVREPKWLRAALHSDSSE